jgi:hypothetical protein
VTKTVEALLEKTPEGLQRCPVTDRELNDSMRRKVIVYDDIAYQLLHISVSR